MPDYAEAKRRCGRSVGQAAAFFCGSHVIDAEGAITFSTPDLIKRFLIPSEEGRVHFEWGNRDRGPYLKALYHVPHALLSKVGFAGTTVRTDQRIVLDMEFTTRLLLDGETLVGLPEKAYGYRRHPPSTSAQGTAGYGEVQRRVLALRCSGQALRREELAGMPRASPAARLF